MSLQEQGWCWEDYQDREGVLLIKSGVADNSGILLTNKKILLWRMLWRGDNSHRSFDTFSQSPSSCLHSIHSLTSSLEYNLSHKHKHKHKHYIKKGGKNICTKKRGSISDLMRFYFQQEWVRPGDGGKHQQDLLRPRQHVSCHWFWFGIISFSHEHRDEKHDENTLIGIVIGDQKGPNIRGSTGSLWALCCSTQLSFWGFTAIQWHPHHLYSCTPAPLGNTMYTAICTLLFAIAI